MNYIPNSESDIRTLKERFNIGMIIFECTSNFNKVYSNKVLIETSFEIAMFNPIKFAIQNVLFIFFFYFYKSKWSIFVMINHLLYIIVILKYFYSVSN